MNKCNDLTILDQIFSIISDIKTTTGRSPQYLHMSPGAYYWLKTALRDADPLKYLLVERNILIGVIEEIYSGMVIIVDREMDVNTFKIICSVHDELDLYTTNYPAVYSNKLQPDVLTTTDQNKVTKSTHPLSYIVVRAESGSEIEINVRKKLQEGYRLAGNLVVNHNNDSYSWGYFQPMIKE